MISRAVSGNLFLVDVPTQTVVDSIFVGPNPQQVRVSKDGNYVLVATSDSAVHLISTDSNKVAKSFAIPFYPEPIWLSNDGSKFYVGYDDGFVVVNTADASAKDLSIGVGLSLSAIVGNSDGTRLYANLGDAIVIIDLTVDNYLNFPFLVTSPPLEGQLIDMDITADDQTLYVTNTTGQKVFALSTTTQDTLIVTDTISLNEEPTMMAVTPDGSGVFVSTASGNVIGINTSTKATTTIDVGEPSAVSVTPDGSKVYVGSQLGGGVTVIDAASQTVDTTISVRPGAVQVLFFGKFISTATNNSSAIEDFFDPETDFSIAQNPATDVLEVLLNAKRSGEVNMQIFDLSGRLIQSEKDYIVGGSQALSMDIRALSPGMYMISLVIGQERYSEKFIKTE